MNATAKSPEIPTQSASLRILLVEDDPVTRKIMQFGLAKNGFTVTAAEDANVAQQQLTSSGIRTYDCVVTDYSLPGLSGLDLLAWIKERDPNLATIIVTAKNERGLIAESLRGGAVDFMDKPVDPAKLRLAVTRGGEQTRRQRRLAESASAVEDLGRAQAWMLGSGVARSSVRMHVCFHPKREAGGDFFSFFRPTPDHFFCLLTDVSGHDLQAAYVSAYFQGVVRGMVERATPITEIFSTFNRVLLEEWSQPGAAGRQQSSLEASVAACALSIDASSQTATVLAHGIPAPVYWSLDGEARVVGETGGFPLGWFPDLDTQSEVHAIPGGGSFCMWTDGLEEVAEKRGVSELSLAWALQRAKSRNEKIPEIESAGDDILVADIHLSAEESALNSFRPFILEQYHGAQTGEIDGMQAFWERSLLLAAPEVPEATRHDFLLASREALLNALLHGCGECSFKRAGFQASYSPALRAIRVRVCDPGRGYQFRISDLCDRPERELADGHRGLILIHHLASRLGFQRNGASLTMDFAST